MSVNKVILVGRVGIDPELKNISNDVKVVNFTLATSEKFTAKDGTKKDNTEWHNIVAFGNVAEIISKYAPKGSEIYLEGKIQNKSWEDKDGVKKYKTEILVNEVRLLGSKKVNENGGENTSATTSEKTTSAPAKTATPAAAKTTAKAVVVDDNEDLPF